jgi:hypothetical protein
VVPASSNAAATVVDVSKVVSFIDGSPLDVIVLLCGCFISG